MLDAIGQATGGFLADLPERQIANVSDLIGAPFMNRIRLNPHQGRIILPDLIGVPPLPPLLEQEWDASGGALIAQGPRPIRVHRAGVVAALSADDDPVKRGLIRDCAARKKPTAAIHVL